MTVWILERWLILVGLDILIKINFFNVRFCSALVAASCRDNYVVFTLFLLLIENPFH